MADIMLDLDNCPLRRRVSRREYCSGDKTIKCVYRALSGVLLRSKEYTGFYGQCLYNSQLFKEEETKDFEELSL